MSAIRELNKPASAGVFAPLSAWEADLTLPPHVAKFERRHVRPAPGRALIVGSRIYEGKPDRRRGHAGALGVDMQDGPGVDVVCDMEDSLAAIRLGRFEHVECLSVLEHCRRPWLVAENIERVLRPSGTLFLAVPFVWRFHGYPSDYYRFTAEGVRALFPAVEWTALMYANDRLTRKPMTTPLTKDAEGIPYLPRTEVCGFGRRM